MKKGAGISLIVFVAACGSNDGYSPEVEALTLSAPLFDARTSGCSVDPSASEVLSSWLSPVRERVGAPVALLDSLQRAAPITHDGDVVEWRVEQPLQSLLLTQSFTGNGYEMELRYSEESRAGTFAWAVGTMTVDQRSGEWRIYAWNGQPKMDVRWERVGEELLVSHDMIGSGRSALRVRASTAETVTLQQDAQTTAVARWDFQTSRGFVEIAGARTCLQEAAGAMCQRVCDDGQ